MQSYETRAYLPPVWDIEKNNGRLRQGTSISGLFKQFRWPLQTEKSVQSKLCEVRGIASYPVHGGVDVGCTRLDVLAMYGGVVTFAGTQSGYGLTVIIDHGNNVESLYGHLDSINVQVGSINKGEKVGVSGAWDGAWHLHFEIRDKTTKDRLYPIHYFLNTCSPYFETNREWVLDWVSKPYFNIPSNRLWINVWWRHSSNLPYIVKIVYRELGVSTWSVVNMTLDTNDPQSVQWYWIRPPHLYGKVIQFFFVATMESTSFRRYMFTRPAGVFDLDNDDFSKADPGNYYLLTDLA